MSDLDFDINDLPDDDEFGTVYQPDAYPIRLSEEWSGFPVFDRPTVARVLGVPLHDVEDYQVNYGQYMVYIKNPDLLDELTRNKGDLTKVLGEGDRKYVLEITATY